jgi:23S rRNA (adenine2503-C2)-methyltransferase
MPINRRYPLADVLEACKEYGESRGGRVTLEYVLLGGVNTSPAAARAVARLARRLGSWVNLIPFNTVPGCGFHPPVRDEVSGFRSELEKEGVRVTQRFRRGRDIAAACGQLKGKHPTRGDGVCRHPAGDGSPV